MQETTEEKLKLEGTWYCLHCKQSIEIVEIEKNITINKDGDEEIDSYKMIGNCPEKHSIILKQGENGIVYLSHDEQKEFAKIFLASLLEDLSTKPEKDILTINAKKAMAGISGLKEDECGDIIKMGMADEWVTETQKLIQDRIAKGDKDILIDEVKIE